MNTFCSAQDKTLKGSLPQEQSPWVPTPGEKITWATYPNGLLPENHRLNKSADLNKGICDRFLLDYQWSVCFFHSFWQGLFTLESHQPTKSASCIPIDEASFVNLSQYVNQTCWMKFFATGDGGSGTSSHYQHDRVFGRQPLLLVGWGPEGFSIQMRKV